jgi:hypothetical protein
MPTSARSAAARSEPPTGDLGVLLEAEARFAALLADARRERDRVIAEATAAAEAAELTFQRDHEADLLQLDDRIAAELRQRLARAEREAEQRVVAWSRLGEAEIAALAARALARLLGEEAQQAAGATTERAS